MCCRTPPEVRSRTTYRRARNRGASIRVQAIRADERRVANGRWLDTAVSDSRRELGERGKRRQGIGPIRCVDGSDVDEAHTVVQPEGGIAKTRGSLSTQLLEHLLHQLLVLVGSFWLRLIADDDGRHGAPLMGSGEPGSL